MYEVTTTSRFDRDLKRLKKRGYNLVLLADVIKKLAAGEKLPASNRDHKLTGNFRQYRECHIAPDWLLVYEIVDETLLLILQRTGSHSDIF